MGKNYAERLSEKNYALFNAGKETGQQFASDCFAIAMKRCGVSKNTIVSVTRKAMEVANEYAGMFETQKKNTLADVDQAHFDEPLNEIFGELYSPWNVRYKWVKECKY